MIFPTEITIFLKHICMKYNIENVLFRKIVWIFYHTLFYLTFLSSFTIAYSDRYYSIKILTLSITNLENYRKMSFSVAQLFKKNFFTAVQLELSVFSPHPSPPTPSKPTSLQCFHPPPWFCPCVLYSSSWKPFSPLSPLPFPLAIVRLFLISMSLVIFCLLFSFVDYVPVKGEIIWYLSLTSWLISLSIMLSSSIHAIAKGISSFFLSLV